jgi:hypothetical protein
MRLRYVLRFARIRMAMRVLATPDIVLPDWWLKS